ncbi:MAG: hypothetical protein EOO73_10045 [Myxococcales bacterium]|nr:MAG: hypothetical protein EOO73_10045 [Myxococcales bacterium]
MRLLLVLLVVSSTACSRAPASPQPFAPSDIIELAAMPEGYAPGPTLSETCVVAPRGPFEDEALSNIDCNHARLSRALRARAGEQGVRFLVGKRCRVGAGSRPRLSCSASLAQPTEGVPLLQARTSSPAGPAPSPAQVWDKDEPRPQDAAQIRVTFRAATEGAPMLPARAYDRVEETAQASVGRRALGQVSARCDERECSADSLRHALRVAAGRVGAGELTSVACFEEGDSARCVATALVPWSS